jgi:hypothetical protein
MKTLLCTLILATLGTAAARADDITVTFDQPSQTAVAGGTLEFFGTITNNTNQTIFLNSDSFNLEGTSFTFEDQFGNVPFTLAPEGQAGDSSGDIEIFDVGVSNPLLDAPGTYLGTYDLLGGSAADGQDVLTSESFSVNISNPVPEPSSIYLLLSGASAALLPISRRLRARA